MRVLKTIIGACLAFTVSTAFAEARVAQAVGHGAVITGKTVTLTKAQQKERIKLGLAYAQSKIKDGPVFEGWGAGQTKVGKVAKTGSIFVSTGDETSPQFGDYVVTFDKKGKPNGMHFIDTYE
jgi:hypothetical protein